MTAPDESGRHRMLHNYMTDPNQHPRMEEDVRNYLSAHIGLAQ